MTDNDDPRIRQLTDEERMSHFDEYPPGTPPIENRLDARVHRLERDNEGLRRDVASLVASRATLNRLLWLLAGALATVLVFAAEKIQNSAERVGETAADIRNLKESKEVQSKEIDQLRLILLKMAGLDQKPTSFVRAP